MSLIYAALFGLAFGSFVNAAIDRIPRGQSLNGRSHCDACGRTLRAWELLPVASYLALRGRCATCNAPIGVREPVLELACGAAFVIAFATLSAAAAVITCAALVALMIAAGVAVERRSLRR